MTEQEEQLLFSVYDKVFEILEDSGLSLEHQTKLLEIMYEDWQFALEAQQSEVEDDDDI